MAKEKKLSSYLEKGWEIKDRHYYVLGKYNPLTLTIPSRHGKRYPLTWFDEEKQGVRELRYATNMSSPFVDEQKGLATMGHIMFKKGHLHVPKQHQALQKLLSLYHPLKGKKYDEVNTVKEAESDLDYMAVELEAWYFSKISKTRYPSGPLGVQIPANTPFKITKPKKIAWFNNLTNQKVNTWIRKLTDKEVSELKAKIPKKEDDLVGNRQYADETIEELETNLSNVKLANDQQNSEIVSLKSQLNDKDKLQEKYDKMQAELKKVKAALKKKKNA